MASQSPTAPSDCPTPLAWQQVLEAFDEQSTSWELDSQRGPIAGRSIGSGPALVFLNPLLGNWRLMALSAWLLRDQFHCVLFDDSSLLARRPRIAPGSVDDLVEDLWSVHEELGLQQLILLGTGLGSGVGLAALGEHDGRIAAAVLQGPLLQTHLTSAEDWLAVLGSHLPGRLRHVPGFRSLMVHNHKPWFPPYDETRLAFAIEVTGAVPLRTAARRARRLDRLDLDSCLKQLAQSQPVPPLLLIVPESLYDPSQPSHSPATMEITSRLPEVRVEALAGCGPLGCLTHPHRLTKLVRSFLDETLAVNLPSHRAPSD